jgi:hypothetical protein
MLSGWIPRLTHGDNVGFSRKRTLALAVAIALDENRTLIDAFNQRELALLNERQQAASFWKSFLIGAAAARSCLQSGWWRSSPA